MSKDMSRPVLRYHGGKFKLAPWIISHFPEHRTYIEPFCGAASVLMQKPRCYAEVINDLDGEIVNVFRVLRDPCQARELERQIRLTPFARSEFEISYLPHGDPIEQARRTMIRSFMGFGSTVTGKWTTGFRNNTSRSGSTPAADWMNYPNEIVVFTERLLGVVIESRPALDVMRQQDSEDTLHYVDPPYVASTRNKRWANKAYRHEMTEDDHRELAEQLHQLRGMVVLSGYASSLYDDELFRTWKRVERATHSDFAQERTEVLWLNEAAASRQSAPRQLEIAITP